ncbi:MAG: DNA mismatch repair protein MutS [Oscillospiraceae bacterium]|nr:DNA mismatch repair protein MutS [Oscillospiraceae bacterium]
MNIDYSKLSPMMKQYFETKDRNPGHILFFRVGDFYEMFYDDAVTVSRVLELTLTGKECGQEERAPMCGVPHHAADIYIKRLIDNGYRVAVCEQVEDPKAAKGLVDRQIVRVVTPGTLTDSNMLKDDTNNYIGAVYVRENDCAVCFADISTGSVNLSCYSGERFEDGLINELSRYAPAELIFNEAFLDCKAVQKFIRERMTVSVQLIDEIRFEPDEKEDILLKQFSAEDIAELGITDRKSAGTYCLCGLFDYIADTQRSLIGRFTEIIRSDGKRYMELDLTARRNLELTETMRNKEKKGSLLWVLDHTRTSMGKRMLKTCIEQPLVQPAAIIDRLKAVEQLCGDTVAREELGEALSGVYDIERLMTKVMYKTAGPRDLKALEQTARRLPEIKRLLEGFSSPLLKKLNAQTDTLEELAALIGNAIVDDPPVSLKDGGVIRDGFNEQLDHLRNIINNGKGIIEETEQKERERTGIKNLKISYNRVFGYYIEVTKSYYELVPADYIRKQTLANCERFITEELKKTEYEIAGANEKVLVIESDIFSEVRDFAASQLVKVQSTASAVAALDVLCSFAHVSVNNGYVCPDITVDGIIDIRDGRHPVVEQMMNGEIYVPNDTYLDTSGRRMSIITGPNMSGKSTYMRQTALIVLMAQMGCFVPASSAKISIADKIFTRVGASDDLTAGQSTFMVEMSEVADILKHATKNSLVILDEVGRGTSTFDGISIATAVAEYITSSRQLGCKTLFATHYHELIQLEGRIDGVKNYSVAVCRRGEDIKFLRKIVEGGTDDSYGIEVAKLAGLPPKVLKRAKSLLADMEKDKKQSESKIADDDYQISFGAMGSEAVIDRIKKTNVDELSPNEALDFLKELSSMLT